jgi:hypothetical protein
MSLADSSPGALGLDGVDGDLPDNGTTTDPLATIGNLTPIFSPTLDNLLPSGNGMDENDLDLGSDGFLLSPTLGGLIPASPSSTSSVDTSALGIFGGLANSLLGSFVTGPANAATAEQEALAKAQLTSAISSQWFGYLLIGLVIFLVFGFIEKK